ncbi:MAG: SRPBCC family protein [Bacteroidota bacterium]
MPPIHIRCTRHLPMPPAAIVAGIMDLDQWTAFTGFAFLPGIKEARFLQKEADITGTRFAITNTDGSRHEEEIISYVPGQRLSMRLDSFSPPLKTMATHFMEHWEFTQDAHGTQVVRSMELFPTSLFFRPMLWFIARFMQKALDAHLTLMSKQADEEMN